MDAKEIVAEARQVRLERRAVLSFVERVRGAPLGEALAAASSELDQRAVTVLALALIEIDGRLSAGALCLAFPWIEHIDLAIAAAGRTDDPGPALIELAGAERLAYEREGAALWLAATRLKPDEPEPPTLLTRLRMLARRELELEPGRMVLDLAAAQVRDPVVQELYGPRIPLARGPAGRELEAELARVRDVRSPLDLLVTPRTSAEADIGPIRRATQKVGRNEPCPCGSGKKYKHCCAGKDREREADASPVAGRTLSEAAPDLHRFLDQGVFLRLRPAELARFDPRELTTWQLRAAILTYLRFHLFEHAERALEVIVERRGQQDDELIDDAVEVFVRALLARGESARALAWIARSRDPEEMRRSLALELSVASPGPETLDLMEQAARAALAGGENRFLGDLVYPLLDRFPALGVLAGRGALDAERALDSLTILKAMDEARDRLLLPLGDLDWEIYRFLDEDVVGDWEWKGDEAAAGEPMEVTIEDRAREKELREEARRARGRVVALEEELAGRNREMKRLRQKIEAAEAPAKAQAGAPAPQAADPAVVSGLRRKVEELKHLIDSGNARRRELEQRVHDLSAGPAKSPAEAKGNGEGEPPDETDDGAAVPNRPVSSLRFLPAAEKALLAAPPGVARKALATAAALAGGTSFAWRQTKLLEGVEDVRSARVGIHHRLLFRIDAKERRLEALDLLKREDLDTALKAY